MPDTPLPLSQHLHNDSVTAPLVLPIRPHIGRLESDNLLSYYGSDDAGQMYSPSSSDPPKLHGKDFTYNSVFSSASDYSLDSAPGETTVKYNLPVKEGTEPSRRLGERSEGGTDRRRLAVVQMNSSDTDLPKPADHGRGYASDFTPPSSLRSRRGFGDRLGDIALVAPPDASPRAYTYLTPPSTAPASGNRTTQSASVTQSGHQRSLSEIGSNEPIGHHRKTSSRDVGIVGFISANDLSNKSVKPQTYIKTDSLSSPIFQQPQVHSASSPECEDAPHRPFQHLDSAVAAEPPILTPEIGQEKDLNIGVAAPIVVNLTSVKIEPLVTRKTSTRASALASRAQQTPSPPFSPPNPPPDINQPHGTRVPTSAPPPQAVFNLPPNSPPPPRPPRLHSPPPTRHRGDLDSVTQPLHLPLEDNPAPRSESSNSSLEENFTKFYREDASNHSHAGSQTSESIPNAQSHHPKPAHRREGAFPPSPSVRLTVESPIVGLEARSPHSEDADPASAIDSDVAIAGNIPASTTIEVPSAAENTPGLHSRQRHGTRQPENNESRSREKTPPSDRGQRDLSPPSSSRSHSSKSSTPNPPPKSPKGLKASLSNLKRFSSLPRPPSATSGGSSYGPRTPSPSSVPSLPIPASKIKTSWPAAMQCGDIIGRRTTLDRCAGYAQKINELYLCDCGLADWLMDVKYKGAGSQQSVARNNGRASGRTPNTLGVQPRKTSRSSANSEASFPTRRLDVTVATDLTLKSMEDVAVPTSPPRLPYPSLAQSPWQSTRSSTSMGSHSSSRSLATQNVTSRSGGFFSSLGRKASVKKDKSSISGSNPPLLSSVKLRNTTTNVPPRPVNIVTAPSIPGGPRAPHRAKRSQTIMISSRFSSNTPDRSASLARRPSLNELSSDSSMVDAEFARQVDKLADLLPRANRNVLAGYLRRAGQDILAIGQYLEDEKNGTVRRD